MLQGANDSRLATATPGGTPPAGDNNSGKGETMELPKHIQQLFQPGYVFTDRELRLIGNCELYTANDPAGLPGHNLLLLISKMSDIIGILAHSATPEDIERCHFAFNPDGGE